jgi:hypothetical protein
MKWTLRTKSSTNKEIMDILFLRDIKANKSGENLNHKKVAKKTKISHKKLLTKAGLNRAMYSELSPVMIMLLT